MRRLLGALVTVALLAGGCTAGSGDDGKDGGDEAAPTPSASTAPAIGLTSLGVDWPRADGTLDVADPPKAPAGFDDALIGRMADALKAWATATTADEAVWHGGAPLDEVTKALPPEVASALKTQTQSAVSPDLAVANVFADEVTVIGAPLVTTAWKVSTETDDAGEQYVRLELQTRAAYEVRLGDDAPTRVIGMLRVHGLSAYPTTTTNFGVSSGWQEFGAGDCALALDDDLVPDTDVDTTVSDLKTFVRVGDGAKVSMPALGAQERVDAEYLERCRNGTT